MLESIFNMLANLIVVAILQEATLLEEMDTEGQLAQEPNK